MSDIITIKDYVEAAYLHGLCVENLDTGELEQPRDISDVQWIVDKLEHLIAQETNKAVVAELNRLHRYDGKDYDTELDEIIDNRIEELTADKEQTP